MYGFLLEWARVRQLAEQVAPLWAALRGEIGRFLGFLDALSRGVGE
jgi:hypothetical protein